MKTYSIDRKLKVKVRVVYLYTLLTIHLLSKIFTLKATSPARISPRSKFLSSHSQEVFKKFVPSITRIIQ